MCEACDKHQWYARSLGQQLRDESEFRDDLSQAERDGRLLAAYWIDKIYDDWPGKYGAFPSRAFR